MKKALLVVDVQNDFTPAGALAVQRGDEVVAAVNGLAAGGDYALVVACKDWHPQNHVSFASNHPGRKVLDLIDAGGRPQLLWPDHCVQGTHGAEFHPGLSIPFDRVFEKGTDPQVDSYSAFMDNAQAAETGLRAYLKGAGIGRIEIAGLATDFCVRASALDGLAAGFAVTVISAACRAVNLREGDGESALREIRAAGGVIA